MASPAPTSARTTETRQNFGLVFVFARKPQRHFYPCACGLSEESPVKLFRRQAGRLKELPETLQRMVKSTMDGTLQFNALSSVRREGSAELLEEVEDKDDLV